MAKDITTSNDHFYVLKEVRNLNMHLKFYIQIQYSYIDT